jgi:uncharacterized protein
VSTAQPVDLQQKSAFLSENLAALRSLIVAYSGGTDSAFLAYSAHLALGEKMIAVIADSASLPRKELSAALDFTEHHHIPTKIIHTTELDNPEYVRNDSQRCFHCKDELFSQLETERIKLGFSSLAYGMNLDDCAEFRPGQQAASKHKILAPLADAKLTKAEIRILARNAGLSLAEKPASACLSSRIEYTRPVTLENLAQVENAEAALHELGFSQVRVRHHGELARIEIDRKDLPRALTLEMFDLITEELRRIGFVYVTVDTQGYRSGSMNDILPVSVLSKRQPTQS